MSFLRRNPNYRGNKTTIINHRPEHKPVSNVVAYILSRYVSNGNLKLPRTQGALAFKQALQRKGVVI